MQSPWRRSWRASPIGASIADRHYNRQKIGSPQFVPPGGCLVLLTDDRAALWTTSTPLPQFVKHAWPGAWINSLFRYEKHDDSQHLASDLIRAAVAHTRAEWPNVPDLGMVSFINPRKVESRNPGYCYLKAGFRKVGATKGGLLAFQMLAADMPDPEPIPGDQMDLFALAASSTPDLT